MLNLRNKPQFLTLYNQEPYQNRIFSAHIVSFKAKNTKHPNFNNYNLITKLCIIEQHKYNYSLCHSRENGNLG